MTEVTKNIPSINNKPSVDLTVLFVLQGKRQKKASLPNTNIIPPPSPSHNLVIPPPKPAHTAENKGLNSEDNVNREKAKISERKHFELELDRQEAKSKKTVLMQMCEIFV